MKIMCANIVLLYKTWDMLPQHFILLALFFVWSLLRILDFIKNSTLLTLIGIVILLFFSSQQLWKFFMWYELSILPMIVIVMGWGLNPSRFSATFYIIIYTILFSLPCLIVFLLNYKILLNCFLDCGHILINFTIHIVLLSLFLVKIPTFYLHYWLLKAHVEASTLGSIVLASGLLKIGGIGLWKILKWLKLSLNNCYIIFRLIFARIISMLQRDIKKLIALISVLHIRVSLRRLWASSYGEWGFILIRLTHTIRRAAIFFYRGVLSRLCKTRLICMLTHSSLRFSFIIFILRLIINLGAPPFLTLVSEWVCFSSVFLRNYRTLILIIIRLMSVLILTLCIIFSLKNFFNHSLNRSNTQFIIIFLISLRYIWFCIEISI